MKNILVLGVCLICLSGCGLFVKTVNVPVWVCPTPPERSVVELKMDSLSSKDSTDDILKALLFDIINLKGQNEVLVNDLNVYKQPPSELRLLNEDR